MRTIVFTLLLLSVLLPLALIAQTQDITGIWFNEEKTSKIEVYKTTAGKYAGKIIWLKEPLDAKGKPRTDIENPDKNLQSRPLMNLLVLSGLSAKGKGKYAGGTIYDPKSGNTYSCKTELTSPNVMKLRGFVLVSVAGRTSTWTRATK